ncbi:MAG: hypothetical protein ACOWWO_00325 [Peptococcaceae bacterium]
MKLSVELYVEKPIFIKEYSYIEIGLRSHGFMISESKGNDSYTNSNGFTALSGSRIAGIGRNNSYSITDRPLGLGALEAKPGKYIELEDGQTDDVHVVFETNILLDPGTIRDCLGIRIVNARGKSFDIPLARPDIEMYWNERGRFVIPITEFINSKILVEDKLSVNK